MKRLIIPKTVGGLVVRLLIAGLALWVIALLDAVSIGLSVFK